MTNVLFAIASMTQVMPLLRYTMQSTMPVWQVHFLNEWGDSDIATILGADREKDFDEAEAKAKAKAKAKAANLRGTGIGHFFKSCSLRRIGLMEKHLARQMMNMEYHEYRSQPAISAIMCGNAPIASRVIV
jgi:hypothetical protein